MKIGVFDSGIGGKSVAKAIELAAPDHAVIFRHDTADHFPYAIKSPEEILGFVTPIFDQLIADGCQIIVIACNTVSTTLASQLRARYTVPLIALEPMVKPAASQTTSNIIAVCATPTTLASNRYAELKRLFAPSITVLEPDCSDWSRLIEDNAMNEAKIRATIRPVLDAGADVIVLGCTHYHWIETDIRQIAGPNVQVLQPESAVVRQLQRVIARMI